MALLDFECKDCNEKFFEIINFTDKDKVICPKCRSKNIKQVFEGSSSFGSNTGKSSPIIRGGG